MFSIFTPLYAAEIDEQQCKKMGGTYTSLGCLFPSEDQEDFVKNPNIYKPNREKCECLGGKWHEEYGCIAPMTEEECNKIGGILDPELGCKKTFTKEQCEKIGGTLKKNGECDLKK